MKQKTFQTAFRDTIPVMTGYLFLGMGFGILLQQAGYGPLWAAAMSLFIYGGTMQYVAVELLAGSASPLTAILSTLLINARHIFYGIAMIGRYQGAGKKKPYLIFSLTDETFSLCSRDILPDGVDRHRYCFFVSLLDHGYWIIGGVLGNLAGALLPINFEGIEFVLTALFVTIFVEQWLSTKNHLPALVGAGSTAACLLIFGRELFLIPTMLTMTGILLGMSRPGKEGKK